jgi:hypothetical protein
MSDIHAETIDFQLNTLFCLDSLDQEDTEAEESSSEVPNDASDQTSSPRQEVSLLGVSTELPPFQLDQELLFRELIAQHQRRLYRFVIKYIDHPDDAADITQQAFVEAARTISSFRGDSKLSTWLFGIAMNMVRNYLRKMIEQDLYELPVLSYQELTPEVNIQPLARVEL